MAREDCTVAILGAGPAGLYAARKLAQAGINVVVINRDVRPGGLAEYGIFHDKHKLKSALRKVFERILADERVTYRGHVCLGQSESITVDDIEAMGFDAVLVAVGAQGIKWIDVEGSEAKNIYDAKQVVYHYNGLPPFAARTIKPGEEMIIIGAGNVAVDITHWAVQQNVRQITWLVRRGPGQVKYTPREIKYVGGHIDVDDLKTEFDRIKDQLAAVGEDGDALYHKMARRFGDERIGDSQTRITMRFVSQAYRVLSDETGHFSGIEVSENALSLHGDRVKCRPTERRYTLHADSLVFCVGDAVDTGLGLRLDEWGNYAVEPAADDEVSYRLVDRDGWFAAGWARVASDGLVGKARKDAEAACKTLVEYLDSRPSPMGTQTIVAALDRCLHERGVIAVDADHYLKARSKEEERAAADGLEDFRFTTNAELLRAAGLAQEDGSK